MPGPDEEADIAHLPFVGWVAPELVFLNIGNTFQDEANGEQYHTGYVPPCPEVRLVEPCDIWRIENSHRQRDDPNPDHLEDPETEEGPEFVAFVVEAIVRARLDDSEEEEPGQPSSPKHDEERAHDLAGMVVSGEGKGYYGEPYEIGAACEV